jgi:polar amino acid transport system substrate-binding protein
MAEKRATLLVILATVVLIVVFFTFSALSPPTDSSLRVGYAIERPYAYLNDQGELTGAYIKTAEKIARRMDTEEIEWIQIRFDKLLSNLRQGHIDLVGSGMYHTRQRDKHFDFSIPFMEVDSAIIVDKSLQPAIENRTLEAPITIAVQAGSVEASRLDKKTTQTELTALEVPYPQTGLESLEAGLSDGLYLSNPSLETIKRRHRQQYEIIAESALVGNFEKLDIGFVFNENDDELRKQWNEASANWVGSDEHIELITRFGFSRDNLP